MEKRIEIIASERGYTVTRGGKIVSPKNKIIGFLKKGYYTTGIRINGKPKFVFAHRLQAYQKYGNKIFEDGIVVRHKNSNSEDNSWDNILIGTHTDNMMDKSKDVRLRVATYASSFMQKYDKEEVREFHKIHNSYKLTMEKFNISSKGTLHYVLKS